MKKLPTCDKSLSLCGLCGKEGLLHSLLDPNPLHFLSETGLQQTLQEIETFKFT